MENEKNNLEKQTGQQPKRRTNSLAYILIAIGGLLIAGNIYFYFKQHKSGNIDKGKLDSLTRQLDTANAKFEIGYGEMSIASYNKMKAAVAQNEQGSLIYPAVKNEIDSLISSGVIHPNYGLNNALYLGDFITLYRQKKLKQMGTAVACLIIKQVGKGKTGSVTLQADHLQLGEISEMYDPTDINKFDYPESSRKTDRHTSLQINLGAMDTGSSWLVPLYIVNGFSRLTEGGDPSGWSVTAGPIIIPASLNYTKKDKTVQKIPLKEVLNRPIEILD
jgi:hypothetical protein